MDDGDKELCLSRKTCDEKKVDILEDLKVTKCAHCGAKKWNILGGAEEGYILSRDDGATCLMREKGGNKAVTTACSDTSRSFTPLHLSFASASDIKAMDSDGARLVNAAMSGDKAAVKRLLKDGVDVDAADFDDTTPIIAASQAGHLDVAKLLFKENASLNTADKDGVTALMEASINGHAKVAAFLVDSGADVNAGAASGVNAAWLAAGEGKLDVLK